MRFESNPPETKVNALEMLVNAFERSERFKTKFKETSMETKGK